PVRGALSTLRATGLLGAPHTLGLLCAPRRGAPAGTLGLLRARAAALEPAAAAHPAGARERARDDRPAGLLRRGGRAGGLPPLRPPLRGGARPPGLAAGPRAPRLLRRDTLRLWGSGAGAGGALGARRRDASPPLRRRAARAEPPPARARRAA